MDKKIFLKSQTVVSDHGIQKNVYTDKEVFAKVESVSQNEFFRAGQIGLTPDIKAIMWSHEYNGERKVEIGNTVYSVYRTYKTNDGKVELYLSKKIGDS